MITLGKKLLTAFLTAALLVLAPGLDAYRAAAADFADPTDAQGGAQAGFSGYYAGSSLNRPLDLSNPAAITSALNDVRDLTARLRQARAQASPQDAPALDSALSSAKDFESALSSYQKIAAGSDLSSSAQALASRWDNLCSALAAPAAKAALIRPATDASLSGIQERERDLSDQLANGASPESSEDAARRVLEQGGPGESSTVRSGSVAPTPQTAADAVAGALNAGDWSSPSLANAANAARLAREAYRQGKISEAQFVTVVLRWEALSDFHAPEKDFRTLPLLSPDGSLTAQARKLFGEKGLTSVLYWRDNGLSIEERLPGLIAALPASERAYFIVRVRDFGDMLRAYKVRESEALWWPVDGGPPGGSYELVVPSFGLLQAMLTARFGNDAVRLLPVFGDVGHQDLLQQIRDGGRAFGLSFPGETDSLDADGDHTGRYIFSLHDFFHALNGSRIPADERRLLPRIADAANAQKSQGAKHARTLPGRVLGAFGAAFESPFAKHLSRLSDLVPDSYFGADGDLLRMFGPLFSKILGIAGISYFVVRDMALNPDAWTPLNVESIVAGMGPDAVQVFKKARGEADAVPSRTLELRFESPRTWLLIAVALAVSWIPFLGTIAIHEAGHFAAARALGARVDHVVLFKATRSLRDVKGEVRYDPNISAAKDIAILLAGPSLALFNASLKLFTAIEAHHILGAVLVHGTTVASIASGGTIAMIALAAASLVYALCGFTPRPGSDLGQALKRFRDWRDGGDGSGDGIARSLRSGAEETIQVGLFLAVAGAGLRVIHALFAGSLLLPAAAAGLALVAGLGAVQLLRELRSEVAGGWQASHDQKYRVGSDGNLRDVRGHKYGEDRYDALAPGEAKTWEHVFLQTLAFAGGLWLSFSSWTGAAVYAGVFAALSLAARWRASRAASKVASLSRPAGPSASPNLLI